MDQPLVSVIMPAYNAEKHIAEAIQSILNQTYQNWELLILDDGSTDQTLTIARKFANKKISVFAEGNKGQSAQLNKGIYLAKGKYIAIAHADDINHKERLQLQSEFLEKHSEIGICGSAIEAFSINSNLKKIITYPSNADICYSSLYYSNPLAHPTVILRKQILVDFNQKYNESLVAAEDYELWIRLSKFTKISNLDKVLVHYRLHDQQTSEIKKNDEEKTVIQSRAILVNQLCENVDKNQASMIFNFFYSPKNLTTHQHWQALTLGILLISRQVYMSSNNAQKFLIDVFEKNLRSIHFLGRIRHLIYTPLLIQNFGISCFYSTTKNLFFKKS
ncbi:glycosyltransferase [Pedobacter chinensis]|uniref:Glycosyltransferase n=1 Tax=Pedobacter chinensis TaxID=2282421 RepID=A0A369PUG5_9SPHI|nr:glycosyltransferase [Pedobacter chinensis]RDC56223.1 glycosyltransferase [Pedobacter chinensis]